MTTIANPTTEQLRISKHYRCFRESFHKAGVTEDALLLAYESQRGRDRTLTAARFLNVKKFDENAVNGVATQGLVRSNKTTQARPAQFDDADGSAQSEALQSLLQQADDAGLLRGGNGAASQLIGQLTTVLKNMLNASSQQTAMGFSEARGEFYRHGRTVGRLLPGGKGVQVVSQTSQPAATKFTERADGYYDASGRLIGRKLPGGGVQCVPR